MMNEIDLELMYEKDTGKEFHRSLPSEYSEWLEKKLTEELNQNKLNKKTMTKEDTDLIGDAIDFYNLNHFKGKDTKKRLVTLKKEIKALTIPVVSQQRELLIAELNKTDLEYIHQQGCTDILADDLLRVINCG